MNRIPMLDPNRQHAPMMEELKEAMARVLRSGAFVLGPEVEAFEREMASYLGVRGACGVGSGTDALLLTLQALGVGPGDEVITTPFTFFASASCAARLGAKPVFVDVDLETYNMRVEEVEGRTTPRTRAVIAVHLFGQMVPLERLELPEGVALIEDVAQALGSRRKVEKGGKIQLMRAGAVGLAGCLSFFPSKNLGAMGDAGMVVSDDEELLGRIRRLRNHGSSGAYRHEELGVNSRLDALQAAVLRTKLPYLEVWNRERALLASRYEQMMAERGLTEIVRTPKVEEGSTHVYHQYVVRAPRRDELMAYLQEGVCDCRVYYPLPLHLQPAFSHLGYRRGDLPNAERLAEEVLALPIFPGMTPDEQERIVEAIARFYAERGLRR